MKIEPKDKVEVKGAKTTFAGKPVIIAAEVKKGDEVLKLRDDSGFPGVERLAASLARAREIQCRYLCGEFRIAYGVRRCPCSGRYFCYELA